MKKVIIQAILLFITTLPVVRAQEVANNGGEERNIPCIEESFDNESSVGALGIGKSTDRRAARIFAMQDAINTMAQRFHINSAAIEPHANQYCMEMTWNDNNECVVYVSIHVSKDVIYKAIKAAQ